MSVSPVFMCDFRQISHFKNRLDINLDISYCKLLKTGERNGERKTKNAIYQRSGNR